MRLVFFYTQYGAADKTQTLVWNKKAPTKNFYAVDDGGLRSEGYFWLLRQLKLTGVFDEILIVIESNRSPGRTFIDGIPCVVLPLIDCVHEFLRPDDIIWVRGGFRSWFVHLEKLKAQNHWLLVYAANTGRQRWPIWNVILDDYSDSDQIDRLGRLWTKFYKPISPEIFHPTNLTPIYDICVGASHIHDRKGQWRTIEALAYYKQAKKRNLKAVMPGRVVKGYNTSRIPQIIESEGLDVDLPGMLPRPKVCRIYNQSKVFVYLGEHGQNDRGPLEALCCGTPVIIANPRYHQSEVYNHPYCIVVKNTDKNQVVEAIDGFLSNLPDRTMVANHFEWSTGARSVALEKMSFMFKSIQEIGSPNSAKLYGRLTKWVKAPH